MYNIWILPFPYAVTPTIMMAHDQPITLELDKEPEILDTVVEPTPEMMEIVRRNADKEKEEAQQVPPSLVAVKSLLGSAQSSKTVKSRKRKNAATTLSTNTAEGLTSFPKYLFQPDNYDHMGFEELRKKVMISKIEEIKVRRLFYEHCLTMFGPLKSFLACFVPTGSTDQNGDDSSDHCYASRDHFIAKVAEAYLSQTSGKDKSSNAEKNPGSSEASG